MSAREVPELTHSQPGYAEQYLKHYTPFPSLRSKKAGPQIQDGSLSGVVGGADQANIPDVQR